MHAWHSGQLWRYCWVWRVLHSSRMQSWTDMNTNNKYVFLDLKFSSALCYSLQDASSTSLSGPIFLLLSCVMITTNVYLHYLHTRGSWAHHLESWTKGSLLTRCFLFRQMHVMISLYHWTCIKTLFWLHFVLRWLESVEKIQKIAMSTPDTLASIWRCWKHNVC